MELLAELFFTALAIVIQLGVPVVVIFVAAFLAERANRRRRDPRLAEPREGSVMSRFFAWLTADEPPNVDQVRLSPCIAPQRAERSAPAVKVATCWQAVKTDNGCLRSECMGCEAFLSPNTAVGLRQL